MRFLVTIHHPAGYDGTLEDQAMHQAIDDLNDEMVARGIRVFVGGLHDISLAKSITATPNGEISVADGPYLQNPYHVGGLWVLECADLQEALDWGAKASVACRAPVEVRQFH